MAYCQNCGTNIDGTPNFCPNCGASLNAANQQTCSNNGTNTRASSQWSNTAKTVGTVAGVAVGASLLGSLLHRRRRRHRPPMGPGPMMGGHHRGPRGPMGGPGGPGGMR